MNRPLDVLTRFKIEGIDVTHPARHVQKNDMGCRLRFFHAEFFTESPGGKASSEHGGKTDPKEATGSIAKEFTAGEFVVEVMR